MTMKGLIQELTAFHGATIPTFLCVVLCDLLFCVYLWSGIDGVLTAYYNCIQRVELYGPTNAAPIINHVANFAASAQREEPQKGAHVSGRILC
jgi:hypothetical protein